MTRREFIEALLGLPFLTALPEVASQPEFSVGNQWISYDGGRTWFPDADLERLIEAVYVKLYAAHTVVDVDYKTKTFTLEAP